VKSAATFILYFFLFKPALFGQKISRGNYEFGLNTGFMVYQGDLSNGRVGSLKTQKLFLDLNVTRLLGDKFSFKVNFTAGKLKGDDSKYSEPDYKRHRNFYFTSPVYEFSGRIVYDIFGKNYSIIGMAPYVSAGAGISFLDIKRDWSKLDADYFPATSDVFTGLTKDLAYDVPSSIPVFPLSAGMKFFISPKWALNAEITYRLTATDYLDGFSKSANPRYNDSYFTYGGGIIYRPGKKDPLGCASPKY
jgi:hypothetical protein